MKKRYLYWGRNGITWTKWFNWNGPKLNSPIKNLKVEYTNGKLESKK